MTFLKKRIDQLEEARHKGALRHLTDAERAVRLMHALQHPELPAYPKIVEFLASNGEPNRQVE